MNSTIVNITVHVSWVSLGYVPINGITEIQNMGMLNFQDDGILLSHVVIPNKSTIYLSIEFLIFRGFIFHL